MSELNLPEKYRPLWWSKPYIANIQRSVVNLEKLARFYGLNPDHIADPFNISRTFIEVSVPDWANYAVVNNNSIVCYTDVLPPLFGQETNLFTWWDTDAYGRPKRTSRLYGVGAKARDLDGNLVKNCIVWCRERTPVPREWWNHRNFKELTCTQ